MKTFLYVIGNSPYDNSHNQEKGNGEWHTSAPNVEDALRIIFGNMPFPGELTGRKVFIKGVSLEGVNEDDVVQVWSNEPEVVKRTLQGIKEYKTGGFHNGRGKNLGLHMEVKVTDIEKYLTPVIALLENPANPGSTALSPMGASLMNLNQVKHDMQLRVNYERMEITRREWELEKMTEGLEERVKSMEQQINVLNTYLHGTRFRTQICSGKKASGKYHVYQERQYLDEEIALLANLQNFDFKKMEDLEKWLVKSGQVWKFLPFERCILATRIRKEKKDYGNPLINFYNNLENMRNMIWVRDGENVFHVDVEFDFNNAVFPDKDQFSRALRVCQDYMFEKSFKVDKSPQADFWGNPLKPGEYDVPGELRHKPTENKEPYFTVRTERQRFSTLEEWLDDKTAYTELLDKQLKGAIYDYLTEVNKKQMVFAVLLQGIVDNTQVLEIPRGTDLFNPDVIAQYFELLFDYSHAITWEKVSEKMAPYIDQKAEEGDWIIVPELEEYVQSGESYRRGSQYKESQPIIFRVAGHVESEVTRLGKNHNHFKEKVQKVVVNYHRKLMRWRTGMEYKDYLNTRTQGPIKLALKSSQFIKLPIAPSLVEQALEDRAWKKDNKWVIPILVNYKKVLQAMKAPKNFTIVKISNDDE